MTSAAARKRAGSAAASPSGGSSGGGTKEPERDSFFRFARCARAEEWLALWADEVDRLFPGAQQAVHLVNPKTMEWHPVLFRPAESAGGLEEEIDAQIWSGTFGRALASAAPLLVDLASGSQNGSLLFCPIGTSRCILAMSTVVWRARAMEPDPKDLDILAATAALGAMALAGLGPADGGRDRGELERAVAILQVANDELRARNKLRAERLASAAHELKTTITSMRMSLGLLVADGTTQLSPRLRELATICQRNTDRLQAIVEDGLDDTKPVPLERQEIDLVTLVEEWVEAFRPAAQKKQIALSTELPPAVPMRIHPDGISQVLHNLIGNAIKFTESGGVTVRAVATEDGVRIVVRDTGVGMTAEDLTRLFERSCPSGEPDAGSAEACDRGIAISRSIVRDHGGHMWAESEPGRGSTFFAWLPSK